MGKWVPLPTPGAQVIPFPKRESARDARVKQLLRIRFDRSQPFEKRLKAAVQAALFGARSQR
jgi:hypothetical protein